MAWMRTNTTTPPPTCTPAWSTLVTMAPVETTTSPDDASRGNGRRGSTRHKYTLPTGASGETRRIMWGMGWREWTSGKPGWEHCCYVVCTPMGTGGVWEERWAGRLLRESEILLGRWRNIGPGGNLRWMHLCTVFSNYIQVDFSCRIPCLTTIPFVIPPQARSIS
jgi:hypothetical protein